MNVEKTAMRVRGTNFKMLCLSTRYTDTYRTDSEPRIDGIKGDEAMRLGSVGPFRLFKEEAWRAKISVTLSSACVETNGTSRVRGAAGPGWRIYHRNVVT